MITDFDRSGKFGASDTDRIMQNWTTAGFLDWWLMKVGLLEHNNFSNIYTETGTAFEIPVLQSLGIPEMEYGTKIIWSGNDKLVVNLDGNTPDTIYEVKCVKFFLALDYPRKLPKKHWRQVQVQMLATGLRKAYVVAYGILDADYDNDEPEVGDIDPNRLFLVPVEYDEQFIAKYVKRLTVLSECLESGKQPRLEDVG